MHVSQPKRAARASGAQREKASNDGAVRGGVVQPEEPCEAAPVGGAPLKGWSLRVHIDGADGASVAGRGSGVARRGLGARVTRNRAQEDERGVLDRRPGHVSAPI